MPAAVLLSFIPLRYMGISVNVMSLAGVAIAFGELIDASIVVVEQTHKKLEQWQRDGCPGRHRDVVISAVKEVAGPTFFALLVIAISFLPVLTLQGQEGRMFRPLAYTKTLAMIVRRGFGHHAGPGSSPAADQSQAVRLPAGLGVQTDQCIAGWTHPAEGTESHQQLSDADLRAGRQVDAALEVGRSCTRPPC